MKASTTAVNKYGFIFTTCCVTNYWSLRPGLIKSHHIEGLCKIPDEVGSAGYIPIHQSYFVTIDSKKMMTGCKPSSDIKFKHNLLDVSAAKLRQTERGLKEFYGCMKFVNDPVYL